MLSRETLLGAASILAFVVGWQVASYFAPSFAVPGWGRIFDALIRLDPYDIFVTVLRIVVSMGASFIFAVVFSTLVFDRPLVEAFIMPLVRLLMAVPGVCWVMFSILWFQGVEFRIFFVMCIVCAPVFIIDTLDAMKSVPQDLRQMVGSFRPNFVQQFTKIILPGIIPNMLTSWKINLTLAVRIVITAELVGALTGIGHELVIAQETFSIAQVFAWTIVLVAILLFFQGIIAILESKLLRWRRT